MTGILWGAAAIAALLALAAVLAWYGAWRWQAATGVLLERLEAARSPMPAARFDAARDLAGLPAPVQRFFRAALADGTPLVAAVSLAHRGTFNPVADGPARWVPFTSTQRVTTRRPGFVWSARMVMGPGATVQVHDAYVAGEGLLHAAMLGLVSLADLRGASPEPGGVAHGEFMRYLAEAAWYPTALLPSQGAVWTSVDSGSARVDLADGSVGASLLLRFDPATGLIDSVRAEARGRTVGKAIVLTPWEGRWWDYAEHAGMKVPMSGEVAWLTPEGRRTYWRGRVTALAYDIGR
ncbi:MAG: hypothetical protein HY855_22315 [Burkholderiales bacterium]|nr:hypothetical protein [Burkholderiales bacterium]